MLGIRAGWMFDGTRLQERPLVLVTGRRIADVDCTGAEPPEGCQLVDLGDVTLLPGLIDTHAHLVLDASTDPAGHLQAVTDEALLAEARLAARQALDAGVTCVRDLGDRSYLAVRLRQETGARPELGPDIVPAGPPITVAGGHCWFLGGVTRGSEIREAVRQHADRGSAVIKVMSTGGHMTSGPALDALAACQFSADELRAAAEEAHRHGLPITAHAHGRDGIVAAHQAGFDGVEHASFLTARGLEPDPRVIHDLAASGTFVSTCIPGTVPGIPLPPIIAALMEPAVRVMRSLVTAALGSSSAPTPELPRTNRTTCCPTRSPTWPSSWATPARCSPRPSMPPRRATSPTARAGSHPGSTPTSSPSTATPSLTSPPSTAASPYFTAGRPASFPRPACLIGARERDNLISRPPRRKASKVQEERRCGQMLLPLVAWLHARSTSTA